MEAEFELLRDAVYHGVKVFGPGLDSEATWGVGEPDELETVTCDARVEGVAERATPPGGRAGSSSS